MIRRYGVLLLWLMLLALGPTLNAQPHQINPRDKIDPDLLRRALASDTTDYVAYLAPEADLAPAYAIDDWAERGDFVVKALQNTALISQEDLLDFLEGGIQIGTVEAVDPFFVVNAVAVTSDADTMLAVAAMPEVTAVEPQDGGYITDPIEENSAQAVTWGVGRINADAVWSSYGTQGAGVVVGAIDSGVKYDHPALVNQYRGYDGAGFDHNFNFYDGTSTCGAAPCDSGGHGTHVMGTIAGGDGENAIGVAPGARWIAAKACFSGYCDVIALLRSAQWMLAPCPVGVLPGSESCDPALRPQVVNNSWSTTGGSTWYQASIDAWRASGIIPVFIAGNDGPNSGSMDSPADACNAIAVGATTETDTITEFSSRGPGAMAACPAKPDVAAPGRNVRSATPAGGYVDLTGTSMAAPHVTGCIALLKSIDPSLVYAEIYNLLTSTAVDIDAPGYDYNAGHGLIDCLGAANQLGFTMSIVPGENRACRGDLVQLDIALESVGGYGGAITLGAADGVFTPNPLTPPDVATFSVDTTTYPTGTQAVPITATSSVPERTATISFDLWDVPPSATGLVAPQDGASSVGVNPLLTWGVASGAVTFEMQVATEPTFATPLLSLVLNDPAYQTTGLQQNAVYYWRVRALNPCGSGDWSAVRAFRTTVDEVCALELDVDFEGDVGGWSSGGNGPGWATSAVRAHSAPTAFRATDVGYRADQWLVSPDVTIAAAATAASLDFWHYQSIEARAGGCYDGGVLEITTNGGVTWSPVAQPLLSTPYDGLISTQYTNPLAGRAAWCGDPRGWTPTTVDLLGYAGETVRFRWRLGSDSSIAREGWYLDDVQVEVCQPENAPEADFSDLPAGFGIAWHAQIDDTRLGSLRDADTSFADGDDDGSDDGIILADDVLNGMGLAACSDVEVSVSGTVAAGSDDGVLNAWIDWNGNGWFGDTVAGVPEHIVVDSGVPFTVTGDVADVLSFPAGATTIDTFTLRVPCSDAVVGVDAAMRWRLTAGDVAGNDQPVGQVDGGEVEDYRLPIYGWDFGDAPDFAASAVGSQTMMSADDGTVDYVATADQGARHLVTDSLRLGACVDLERNGVAALAGGYPLGDDMADGLDVAVNGCASADDEDYEPGLGSSWSGGSGTLHLPLSGVGVGGACVHGWVDWDGDGFSADDGFSGNGGNSYTTAFVTTGATAADLTWTTELPQGAFPAQAYLRLRVVPGSCATLEPVGPAIGGEVQDHVIFFTPTHVTLLVVQDALDRVPLPALLLLLAAAAFTVLVWLNRRDR